MQIPKNTLKQKLQQGDVQYGLWAGIADTTSAEICAGAGFDWLLIDAEHAPFHLADILSYLQTIAAYAVPAIVRPPSDDRNLLKQLLDLGAQTLLLPMVESAGQAERIVQSVYYPPEGVRGLGTALARAARWNRVTDYLHQANNEMCIIVQVETTRGIENLKAIAGVAGVDGIFIGPADLSASMGHLGHAGHPAVVNTIEQAMRDITAMGKFAGVLSLDKSLLATYLAAGARFVGVAVDTLLLAEGTARVVREVMPDTTANRPGGSD